MGYKAEKIVPYNNEENKTTQVRTMFDNIAPHYDSFNHLASFSIDKYWRKCAVNKMKEIAPQEILDVATGTGDLAITCFRNLAPKQIIAVDLSTKMMDVGRKKVAKIGGDKCISFQQEDCMDLSFESDRFDACTVAMGVRNFADIEKGYCEMFRVLKSGGKLFVLELTIPRLKLIRLLYTWYSRTVMPLLGALLSKDKKAYTYLPKSVEKVPMYDEMTQIMKRVGFKTATFYSLTFGICTLYVAEK